MSNNNDFNEFAKAKIQEKRNLVISENLADGGFTIAQQIIIEEGSRRTTMFMKGAIHVDNIDGLYSIRDAMNEAIQKIETK